MKKLFVIYLILLAGLSFGQNKILIDDPFVGLPMCEVAVKEVDSLKQLPTRISFIISNLLKTSMTDFERNIVFVKGQIVDIENWAAKDSTFQLEYKFAIPKYELYFELCDTSIGIKNYCFEISLDQYGQILRFEWPREDYNKRDSLIKPIKLKKTALEYATKKKYKTQACEYSLHFDEGRQRMLWYFSFLQKTTGDNFNYFKEYTTIVVDPRYNYIVEEVGTMEVGNSD